MLLKTLFRQLSLLVAVLITCQCSGQISTTSFIVYSESEQPDSIITASGSDTVCPGEAANLALVGGSLGDNAKWYWFTDGCGTGTPFDSGSSITVVPTEDVTTYYCASGGGCNMVCQQITIFRDSTADCSPLPIHLQSFDVVLVDKNKGHVSWTATGEEPGIVYELDKSFDGGSFSLLHRKNAKGIDGRNSYTYLDDPLTDGYNYYRLRTIYPDGNTEYSQIKVLYYSSHVVTAKLYPNPTEGQLTFEISLNTEDEIEYWVTNAVGQTGFVKSTLQGRKGLNAVNVQLSMLAQGAYLFHYRTASGLTGVIKFSKIN